MTPVELLFSFLLAIVVPWLIWLTKAINQLSRDSRELHKWHSPDSTGRQEWRGAAMREMLHELRGLRADIKEECSEISNAIKALQTSFSHRLISPSER